MKTPRLSLQRLPHSRRGGFTMTELALCIAVVSVALVAIIGVLPTGLTVQRHNREDTIVTEDGKVLMNAIRTASTNAANLLPQFDFILWERYRGDAFGERVATPEFRRSFRTVYWDESAKLTAMGYTPPIVLTNVTQIVSLMSMPRYVSENDVLYINVVRAQVRAISGALTEKSIRPQPNPAASGPDGLTLDQRNEFAFRYLVTSEVTDVPIASVGSSVSQALATAQQIHELALTFQWPVVVRADQTVERLRVGNNRRVYRSQVFAQLMPLNPVDAAYLQATGRGLQHFTPGSF